MPYKDPVNEHVKRVTNSINRRFIAHTDMLGSTNAINSRNPSVEPQGNKLFGRGRIIGGGEGCAHWTASSANKRYDTKTKDRSQMSGGAILGLQDGTIAGDMSKPIQSKTHYDSDSGSGSESDKDNNKFGALGNALASRLEAAPLGPTASNARSGYAHKDNSPLETQSAEAAKKLGFGKTTKRPRKSTKNQPMEGDGFFSDMWDGIKSGANTIASVAKPLLHLIPHPAAQAAATGLDVMGYGAPKECSCPLLKSGKAPKRCKCGARMSGGSGFAAGTHMDVGSGETMGISSHKKTVGAGKPRGRPRKTGGAVLGLVKAPVAGPLDNTPAAYGNVKVTPQSTSKIELDKPTTKADMPSSTLSGLGKQKRTRKPKALADGRSPAGSETRGAPKVGGKRSARADIVKKVMKDRGCTLMQASSIVKKEGLYKP